MRRVTAWLIGGAFIAMLRAPVVEAAWSTSGRDVRGLQRAQLQADDRWLGRYVAVSMWPGMALSRVAGW